MVDVSCFVDLQRVCYDSLCTCELDYIDVPLYLPDHKPIMSNIKQRSNVRLLSLNLSHSVMSIKIVYIYQTLITTDS